MNIQYNPLYKSSQVIAGTGQIVIITGWMPKEKLAKLLNPQEYAAIGQLYSPTTGINFIVRNLLCNPQVHYLIAINATQEDKNAGGVRCLVDFFNNGFDEGLSETGKKCWTAKSDIRGYIDAEIPADALEELRNKIAVVEVKSIDESIKICKLFNLTCSKWKADRQSLTFPMSENTTTTLPGALYGHRIEGKTIAETWVKIIHRIKTTGQIRPNAYGGKWQELIDLMAIVTDEPDDFYFEPNYLPIGREFLDSYIAQILEDSNGDNRAKYTYGQRLRSWFGCDQIQELINRLNHDINSARAVMNLWDANEDIDSSTPPCLNHIWVKVVDGELSLTATFRSNDMFSAWCANAMGLRALQKYIADNLQHQARLGPLITISQSAHIYDDCWENADKVIEQYYGKNKPEYCDPVGNFIVETNNGKIHITRTTRSGEVVDCYSGTNPLALIRQIAKDAPGIEPGHIGYMGIELSNAVQCLKNGIEYRQDK